MMGGGERMVVETGQGERGVPRTDVGLVGGTIAGRRGSRVLLWMMRRGPSGTIFTCPTLFRTQAAQTRHLAVDQQKI